MTPEDTFFFRKMLFPMLFFPLGDPYREICSRFRNNMEEVLYLAPWVFSYFIGVSHTVVFACIFTVLSLFFDIYSIKMSVSVSFCSLYIPFSLHSWVLCLDKECMDVSM